MEQLGGEQATEFPQDEEEGMKRKYVGFDTVNIYHCAVIKLWEIQSQQGANNLNKEQLRSNRIKLLLRTVKFRKKRLARENYEEKIESSFMPFTLVQEVGPMERLLFRINDDSEQAIGSLRDRFMLLMTTFGILRGESLIKCELSDLCDVVLDNQGVHDIHILVIRIMTGKTNGLKTLFGRVIRHKDVYLCAIGVLGLYLLARWEFSDEVIDWSTNESWFNIKLLVSTKGSNVNSITDQTYSKRIKKVFINKFRFARILT
jgi:Centromere DNA-binding protein complex CBF3 subunit, domain 2